MADEADDGEHGYGRVITLGICVFIVGHLAAGVSLALKPVQFLSSPPTEGSFPEGEYYALRGERGSPEAWRAAASSWEGGSEQIRLSEGALNAWSDELLRQSIAPAEGEPAAEPGLLQRIGPQPQRAQFRLLDDNQLEIAVEYKWSLPGLEHAGVYVARGKIEEGASGWRFDSDGGQLGQAPVGVYPPLNALLAMWLRSGFSDKEGSVWLRDNWSAISELRVEDGDLVITRAL